MGANQSSINYKSTSTIKKKRSNVQLIQPTETKPVIMTRSVMTKIPVKEPIIPKFNTQQCEALFDHYADPDTPAMITPDGTQRFFEDLGLSIEDILIFAIAWKMQTSTMGYISKEEWMKGMKALETDSMDKLRAKRAEFEELFSDEDQFKEVYKYTFNYAKNKDQKCMEVETATILWSMLLASKYPIVIDFVRFMEEKTPVKVINRDQWYSFLEFASSDLVSYDESSAWPVLFDEFVDWKREQE